MNLGSINIAVGWADIVLSVVGHLVSDVVCVVRTIRLYPLGVLVYVVIVPVLSVYVPASMVFNVVFRQ